MSYSMETVLPIAQKMFKYNFYREGNDKIRLTENNTCVVVITLNNEMNNIQ